MLLTKKKRRTGPRSKATRKRRASVIAIDGIIRARVYERDGHKCVRCGTESYLTPSHVYPKGTFGNIRWELDNLKTLCISCHRWWHMNPVDATDWWRKNWPERYERLNLARHVAKKPNINDFLEELSR